MKPTDLKCTDIIKLLAYQLRPFTTNDNAYGKLTPDGPEVSISWEEIEMFVAGGKLIDIERADTEPLLKLALKAALDKLVTVITSEVITVQVGVDCVTYNIADIANTIEIKPLTKMVCQSCGNSDRVYATVEAQWDGNNWIGLNDVPMGYKCEHAAHGGSSIDTDVQEEFGDA